MVAVLGWVKRRREERSGNESGFTLIELLIVIVILAILAAIVVFAVQDLSSSTAKASCKADFKSVETAVEGFKAQTGAYPGGTYYSGYTVNASGTPATPATYTAPGAGVPYLLQTNDTDSNGKSIGPWLKEWPVNGGHYQISVDTTGAKGTIDVYNTASPTPALVAGAGATHTAADCDSVS